MLRQLCLYTTWLVFLSLLAQLTYGEVAYTLIEQANRNAKPILKDGERVVFTDIKLSFKETAEKEVVIGKAAAAIPFTSRLWPGAVIPYTFARNLEKVPNAKTIIKDAMFEWESNTCIRFSPRENENDYVEFSINSGCNADVGRRGDRQIVSLGDGCRHKSVVIHEIGHVIGFWHEQNRPDRDQFVNIFTDNIMDQYKEAFAKFDIYRINSMRVTYDYHSIMHYGMKAFSKNRLPTILPKKPGIYSLGNNQLSPLDIKQTNLLYKCEDITRGWTMWSRWTNCDKSCAGGTQERTRVCTSLKAGKQQCKGAKIEKRVCNTQKCPEWPKFPSEFSFERLRVDHDPEAECVLVYERADYREWSRYSFCNRGKRKLHMRWSDQGTIAGMKCTGIFEPRESHNNRWYDNYLCLPPTAPYNFTWTNEGKSARQQCIQWFAKEGRDGWDNNFLCADDNSSSNDTVRKAPIHGGWSSWTRWAACNKECGTGRTSRLRMCNNPKPQHGGQPCVGGGFEDAHCNTQPCPTCGGVLAGTKGEFHSPNYPANYPSNTNCTWVIQGNQKKKILLTIRTFDFEKFFDEPCKFDYLHIRDKDNNGKELGKLCGKEIPQPIISEHNSLWINMITDREDNKAGFRASWELQEPEPEGCGGLIKGMKGKFNSPNFPKNYPAEKTCIWKIEAPKGYYIQMKFIRFELESHYICKYDSVEVVDGWDRKSSFGLYCGENPKQAVLKTHSNRALVKFLSDHSNEFQGFKLSWRAYKKVPSNTLPPVDEKTGRECPEGWKYFANNLEGGACYRVKRNYFNWYAARDDCLANSADLVSITTKPEQDFVTRDLLQGNYMWLGMTDEDNEGRWAWSDNTTTTAFNNWDQGDPNNGGQLQNEDCALIKPDGKWNDFPCEDRFNYICKIKPVEPWNVDKNRNSQEPPRTTG